MNLNHAHKYYTCLFIIFCSSLQASVLIKYNYEEREFFTKEFSVDDMSKVYLTHKDGIIEIKQTKSNVAKIEVELIVRGDVKEDLQTIIQQYELNVRNNGNNIQVKSNTNIKSRYQITTGWIFTKTRSGVKFNDGTEINSKVTDVISKATLYLPSISLLHLENKHHDIIGENLDCDVEVILYDSNLELGNITGNVDLDLKHGSAHIGNFKDGKIQLFDSKVLAGNSEDVILDAKHSELKLQDLNSMKMTVFDSEIELDHVEDRLDMEEKHSRISVKSIGLGTWENFDSNIKIGQAKSLDIKAKHSAFEIGEAGSLNLDIFDSQFELGTLGSLSGMNFKHSILDIDVLELLLDAKNVFDTNIEISTIQNDFQSVNYEGKSSELLIGTQRGSNFTLEIKLKHGYISYPEEDMELTKFIEKDSKIEIVGTKGNQSNAPSIHIEGTSVEVTIK